MGPTSALTRTALTRTVVDWGRSSRRGAQVAPFKVVLTALRCVGLAASVLLVGFAPHPLGDLAGVVPLGALAVYRVFRPIRASSGSSGLGRVRLEIALEVALALAVMAGTGWWRSEYVFCLLAAITVAGLSQGFIVAIVAAAASSIVLTVAAAATHHNTGAQSSVSWTTNLVLLAVVSGYSRWMFGQAETRDDAAAESVRLATTNSLLTELQGLAQNLSVSLDLTECAQAVAVQVREALQPEILALIVHQEASQTWDVIINDGLRIPTRLAYDDLPGPARRALEAGSQCVPADLGPPDASASGGRVGEHGLSLNSRSGLYIPLVNSLGPMGVIALEHTVPERWDVSDADVAQVLGSRAVLALDNALRFSALCVFGPGEERNRIAQDLHDHLGQSLAALGLEMDRINRNSPDHPAHDDLIALRLSIRDVVAELRGTLRDLRTDVTAKDDLVTVLYWIFGRQADRYPAKIVFQHNAPLRLPLIKERQVLLIAKEAVDNARRHAGSKHIWVMWSCQPDRAILEVSDDGDGFQPPHDVGAASGANAFGGLAGMYRRAAAIDATLTIKPVPAGGTVVRCTLRP
ncbi:MAG: GAF domain-containing sensor histidine kinase [Acidimicrobiales bacterium]